jgi:hypothetical protein
MGGYQLIDESGDGCCIRKSSYTLAEVLKKMFMLVDNAILLVGTTAMTYALMYSGNIGLANISVAGSSYIIVTMIIMIRDINHSFNNICEEIEDENEEEAEAADEAEEREAADTAEEREAADEAEYDDLPPLIPTNEYLEKLNSLPIYEYNKNDIVLAQLQRVVDETNLRNMWRRGELKVD